MAAVEQPVRFYNLYRVFPKAPLPRFENTAISYYKAPNVYIADKHGFRVEATSNWADINGENLKQYKLVVWLNGTSPTAQQPSFQRYMENGGAWFGFHVAAHK